MLLIRGKWNTCGLYCNCLLYTSRALDCVLQFVRSGRVAITTSCFERVNEYLADRETKYRLKKEKEQNNE